MCLAPAMTGSLGGGPMVGLRDAANRPQAPTHGRAPGTLQSSGASATRPSPGDNPVQFLSVGCIASVGGLALRGDEFGAGGTSEILAVLCMVRRGGSSIRGRSRADCGRVVLARCGCRSSLGAPAGGAGRGNRAKSAAVGDTQWVTVLGLSLLRRRGRGKELGFGSKWPESWPQLGALRC